jgi:uncharacterized coiled-coil protein SlyX
MATSELDSIDRLRQRVTDLEALFTHLQRSVQDLDKVILDQQRQLDAVRGQMSRLMLQLEQFTDLAYEPRRPEEERPPHY